MKSNDLRLLLSRSGSRSLVFVSAIGSIFWSAVVIANAVLLAKIIISIIEGGEETLRLIALLGGLWLIRIYFQTRFEFWCSKKASEFKEELRNEITNSVEEFKGLSATTLTTLTIKGLNSLDIYIGRFIPQSLFSGVVPVAVIATIAFYDLLSAVIAVFTLPLIPFFGALIGRYTADSVNKKWRSLGTLSDYFEDSLRGFITLKIFGRSRSQSKRIAEMGEVYTKETMKVLRISFLSALALELCATISVALIAVSVGLRLVDSNISFVSALTVLILAPEVYFPLRNAASLFHASADGSQAMASLRVARSEDSHRSGSSKFNFDDATRISWNEWSLNLIPPSRIDADSVSIGECLFLIGESGTGKSTFALELVNQALESGWSKKIAWIPQSPHLAPASVRDQFLLLNSSLTDKEIIDQLSEVGLELADLPQGLLTQVGGAGEGSSAASGGQIRKIAVARALALSPSLIIADEPGSDLDRASIEKVMSALRSRSQAALICITHDLSLPSQSDRQIRVARGTP